VPRTGPPGPQPRPDRCCRPRSGDLEGAFQIAYDGCRKVALALVLAYGVRAKGEGGHHGATFNAAAAALASNNGARFLRSAAKNSG